MRLFPSDVAPVTNPVRGVMPPSLDRLLQRADVRAVRVGAGSLGDTLDDVVRFRFEGDGDLATRMIVGDSEAARAVLAGARGPAVRSALTGLLEVFDKRDQPVVFTGLSMAPTTDAFLGNLLISDAEQSLAAGRRVDARTLGIVAQDLVEQDFGSALGVYDGAGWMHLDPRNSREFDERVAAGPSAPQTQGELLATLQHELEHAVTPSLDAEYARLPWLEEASAEVLTQWSGAVGELATHMHVSQRPSGYVAYEPQVRVLETWLHRAGLDLSRAADLQVARDLLQSSSLAATPRRMAEAVVAREGSGNLSQITREIEAAFADDAFGSQQRPAER